MSCADNKQVGASALHLQIRFLELTQHQATQRALAAGFPCGEAGETGGGGGDGDPPGGQAAEHRRAQEVKLVRAAQLGANFAVGLVGELPLSTIIGCVAPAVQPV